MLWEKVRDLEEARSRGNILLCAAGAKANEALEIDRKLNLLVPLIPSALLQPHTQRALDRTHCPSPVEMMRLITEEFCSHQSRTL
jgi:hypothetical protein